MPASAGGIKRWKIVEIPQIGGLHPTAMSGFQPNPRPPDVVMANNNLFPVTVNPK